MSSPAVYVVDLLSAKQLGSLAVEQSLKLLKCSSRIELLDRAGSLLAPDEGLIRVIYLSRPSSRNAVNRSLATQLSDALLDFDSSKARVCILIGEGGNFCAGADLKAVESPTESLSLQHPALERGSRGPIGPTRMRLTKPVLAAIDGFAVAGGLELSLLADMRICTRRAVFGVFCRRFGVPLIDGGTIRLPRIIGLGRALDMVLTGRPVAAEEALAFGLANKIVEDPERLLPECLLLAATLCAYPQSTMLADRQSVYHSYDTTFEKALEFEFDSVRSSAEQITSGARAFASGQGRSGVRVEARL